MIFLLFWLTSLSITISRPIHVDANGIISFFFNGWVIPHCIYIPHLLYQFLCWWTINHFSYAEILSLYTHFHSVQFSSVAQFCLPLRLHGVQHARPSCPSLTPGVYSNSCPLSRWCHPTISSSVIPFSSHPQSFPASGYFQMNQFFISGGQSIRVSASTSVLSINVQDWFPLEWTGWISLQSKGLSRVFSNTTVPNHQFFGTQLSL